MQEHENVQYGRVRILALGQMVQNLLGDDPNTVIQLTYQLDDSGNQGYPRFIEVTCSTPLAVSMEKIRQAVEQTMEGNWLFLGSVPREGTAAEGVFITATFQRLVTIVGNTQHI